MKARGITGVKRGKTTCATKTKTSDSLPLDKVQRQFVAKRPNQLWVAGITYVATWQGFAYVALVTDVFSRKIVGWSVSSTLKTDMLPQQALNMVAWMVSRDLTGPMHHSDRGSNYVSLAYTDRTVELGGTPSVGSKGDIYDNTLARSQFALFKTELVRKRRPGEALNKSSWRRWNGCGGSTTNASTQSSTTGCLQKLKQSTALKKIPCYRPLSTETHRNKTQGYSHHLEGQSASFG